MQIFEDYLESLKSHNISQITEYSHRSQLHYLIKEIAKSVNPKIEILHEPKRDSIFGSPDFRISISGDSIGYIENKKINENLDKIIKSEQIKKYQTLTDNILITNYLQWVLLKGGQVIERETLCYLTDLENKRSRLDLVKIKKVNGIIKNFLSQAPKGTGNAKKLAFAMAVRAKLLKDFLLDELKKQETENREGELYGLYKTFKNFVFKILTLEEFADAFAQMLVYGLFLARLNADTQKVTLYNAKKFVPRSFELIKELVDFLDELDNPDYSRTRWIVEEILTIMNNLDLTAIAQTLSFNKKAKDLQGIVIKDPYVYFYEDFLASYDKKLRKSKGVYYTPPPVVNFIIRAINDILKKDFGINDGLADREKVTVLDFACGTGTFLLETCGQIFEELPGTSGKRDFVIREHILKNLYGFEYLIPPYTVAHLKLSQFLKDKGYKMADNERFQIFLTNTLEQMDRELHIDLLPQLSDEITEANEVKNKPILVITGNPPYSGHSKNVGDWINKKLKDYYFVDGKPLGERNPKWLQDDYVKFIRFAQWKMESVEEGIVAVITNHSFLDNPTFRGMRQSLTKTFDRIYFIDLHGNTKKKEICPDGTKDENVFDVQQGVAISIMVKTNPNHVIPAPTHVIPAKAGIQSEIYKPCKIYHSSLWGLRENKYKALLTHSLETVEFKEIKPSPPFYLFVPQDETLREKYEQGISVKDIFDINSVGIVTAKDKILISYENENPKDKIIETYGSYDNKFLKPICYRPFDTRKIYYDTNLVERDRKEVMQHMIAGNNMGLVGVRNVQGAIHYNHVFTCDKILDGHLHMGLAYLFPLYTYQDFELKEQQKIPPNPPLAKGDEGGFNKTENFKPEFRQFIDKKYNCHYTPEAILGYIYAILHSTTYRSRYAQFLKIDFPRIPFTKEKENFDKISALGTELINAHLMEKTALNKIKKEYDLGYYTGKGADTVEKVLYKNERIYINKDKYFGKVPENVWNFYIGGYQVLSKYFKNRKNKSLNINEIENVENVIKILSFTINKMQGIDERIKKWM